MHQLFVRLFAKHLEIIHVYTCDGENKLTVSLDYSYDLAVHLNAK